MPRKAAVLLAVLLALLIGLHLAFRPPPLEGRAASAAVQASAETPSGRLALAGPEGLSGVLPLIEGPEAFAARVALIRGAAQALDVQYYIWQRDATGLILLDELRRAAERGVRVRLLLDDNGIAGLDADLAALDALAGVEVRLFNPFILRRPKVLGYAFDFVRLNRRMHNKSLTADGAISILGGRNIGDIYFAFGEGVHYIDTDVLVAGPAAHDVGADFDRYWASGSAYPAELILPRAEGDALARLVADAEAAARTPEGRLYAERLARSDVLAAIGAGLQVLEWTRVALVSDDPAKGLGQARVDDLLFPQLMALLARPGSSVDLVSAYFVPGRRFTEALAGLARSGTRVRILTNSQAATDVILVHGAYVKYRPDLLAAGAELYELKPGFAANPEKEDRAPIGGSSRASLHSKIMAVDGRAVFIGSFNFDPRSFELNTEMGVLIDSPRLAAGLSAAFATTFRGASYRLSLQDRALAWEETAAGEALRHGKEPGAPPFSRLLLALVGLLPIEWLL
ncbi:phosphatidylserine/phosphatidylglycerophosphate/cardiolipin synthase family protein [Paracoccus sp. (in: a-proteobacteria)]|uniref:phospholipase D-like domain-containing protein n=1 Tax=Paracoccus sp. TaxID=267 RepID=UPI0026DF3568|nr:phospholipase D family protein [Paracoccus sp. (in: a-proteobacteria)]MDO5371472.1 phospholipase D family protein [Paracoccus sp. (in: a-proteobacteria)]